MPWTGEPNGGFSTAAARDLWLPVSGEYKTINVQAQLDDPRSILNLYRRLLTLRKQSLALRLGTYRPHPATDARCLVYTRTAGRERKLVALNLTGQPCERLVRERATVVLSTETGRTGEDLHGLLRLAANEGVVADLQTYSKLPAQPGGSRRTAEF
jgi:glycosidase